MPTACHTWSLPCACKAVTSLPEAVRVRACARAVARLDSGGFPLTRNVGSCRQTPWFPSCHVFPSGSNPPARQDLIFAQTRRRGMCTDTPPRRGRFPASRGETAADADSLLRASEISSPPVSIYRLSNLRTHTILRGKGNLTNEHTSLFLTHTRENPSGLPESRLRGATENTITVRNGRY